MIFAYRHTDGRVVLTVTPSQEALARQPFVSEVLKELPRLPGHGEKFDATTLEIVAAALPDMRDVFAELDALKARVAALESRT